EPVYESVDLGLPSGVKWATCNVGASKPEEYGGYYAWGEIEEKDDYNWSTYKWCNGSYDNITKYYVNFGLGDADNKTVLEPEDDVAHVLWGDDWRMPTRAEQDELLTKCTWTWTALNGVNGYRVTGPNGNSIFLPVTRTGNTEQGYWSSTLASDSFAACCLYLWEGVYDNSAHDRYSAFAVRPVCDGK
ncbi:MAG: hypothetical protein J6U58_05865, partial [Bacteroidaceae bacterium]|nr:hypothetical protein [Bacteroidaceae bacterium]